MAVSCLRFHTMPPTSLYGVIYATWYISHLPEPIKDFRYAGHVTTMFTYRAPTTTSHAVLGNGIR